MRLDYQFAKFRLSTKMQAYIIKNLKCLKERSYLSLSVMYLQAYSNKVKKNKILKMFCMTITLTRPLRFMRRDVHMSGTITVQDHLRNSVGICSSSVNNFTP